MRHKEPTINEPFFVLIAILVLGLYLSYGTVAMIYLVLAILVVLGLLFLIFRGRRSKIIIGQRSV